MFKDNLMDSFTKKLEYHLQKQDFSEAKRLIYEEYVGDNDNLLFVLAEAKYQRIDEESFISSKIKSWDTSKVHQIRLSKSHRHFR